jgi:hypothetical protein
MTQLLALALLALAPAAQDPTPPPAPPPEQVQAAVEALEEAFSQGEAGERVRAIEAGAGIAAAEVVQAIARGLDDKEASVRTAALSALRYQAHPSALEALHAAYRKAARKKIEDKELAELILAIGQHASASSFELLSGGALDRTREHSTRARIRALGRVRDPRAVEELIALMNKAGRGRGGAGGLFERDFRLSLWALTGTDEGAARESWMRWWNDHKRTLTLPEEIAVEPRQLAVQWRALWSESGKERATGNERKGAGRRGGDEGPGG